MKSILNIIAVIVLVVFAQIVVIGLLIFGYVQDRKDKKNENHDHRLRMRNLERYKTAT